MQWEIETPEGYRLKPVVLSHGWYQCRPFRWDGEAEVLERVVRTRGGIHVVEIRQGSAGRLGLTLPGADEAPDDTARARIEGSVIRMLAFDIDLAGFYVLCADHPTLETVPRIGAGRLLRCPTVWEDMAKAICGTNIQWKQAVTLINRISELGDPVPGDDERRAWPTPGQVAEAGASVLRDECRLGYRAPYVAELAGRIASGDLDTGPIARGELDGEDIRRFFLSVKGIGKATANLLSILYGSYDQISIDSAIYNFVGGKYFDGEKPTDAQITELYEPFGEWAALACWYDGILSWWWPTIEVDLG